MEVLINKLNVTELERAFVLIWDVFLEFDAPDYSQEGIETFRKNFIENEDFRNAFKEGRQIMYGAFLNNLLIGVISISINNHVSCVFVDKKYHRNGIATMLFRHIILELKERQVQKIFLNASPFAIPFYHAIGFEDLDNQQDYHGILYTPMELNL
ncbi:GNAT family N-acetyltransferase [Anaerocolumna sp. MB42-C2]|uniref:GNAT family N-acetyltransferase n=1 Tax=Anaerocolumna sp. MB42-C2 TaxID=3070997 RepID=UPI0027E01187|nr:GNAT family N-acetyltransferase [Anaerocolumna sp. MB42-C2]WMJ87659.1 GNAT family N-acetyltransferase [Anaerocolumna sp. MB42-C2]